MNSIVCVKQVPDTEIRIEIEDGQVVEERLQYVINPYDEYALEEALRLREKFGEGQVTVLTLGPERAREAIMQALAVGADEAIHLADEAFQGGDAYATAKALAEAIVGLDLEYDIILCGKQGVDHDNAQVGIALAEMLNLPHVSLVTRLEVAADKSKATVQREVEEGKEVVETPLPAVITAQKGLNEPRYPTFTGIRAARKKPIHKKTAAELGIAPQTIGVAGARLEIVSLSPPPEREAGQIIPGSPVEACRELVRLLREEAKVV
ncbi:MAG TPA: electron transfer flavoprotein subunit beta/FixA family protein [Anaerolineae bacterium]|nr:electron transfer flavoprotein subunit beta/FixA family protein [Anaerolineae bacterium]